MRRCVSCGLRKASEEYLPGRRGGAGRSCTKCLEEQAYEINAKRRRATTWEIDGVWWRRCKECGEDKPLVEGFYMVTPSNRENVSYGGSCRVCRTAKARAYEAALYEDPEKLKRARAKNAAAMKRRAEANPEKARENRKEYWQKLKADPERYAAHREAARISHRLRRERRGLPVRPSRSLSKKAIRLSEIQRFVPSGPLVVLAERMVDQRRQIAEIVGDEHYATIEQVCQDLGVSTRSFRRWRSGVAADTLVGVAEAVLLNADVAPEDVFSLDDDREALEVLLSPERVRELAHEA